MERPRSGTERTPCCRRAHRPQRADHTTSRIGHNTAPNRFSRLLRTADLSRNRRLIPRGTGSSNSAPSSEEFANFRSLSIAINARNNLLRHLAALTQHEAPPERCRRLHGMMPDLAPAETGDFYFVDAADAEEGVRKLVAIVRERIPKRFGLDPIRDIQVLCPMNRGGLGARSLNIELQNALNPPGEIRIDRFGWTFCPGDKVMQIENDYDKEVYNGDLGVVSRIDVEESELTVDFDSREVVYGFGELDELVLAYATTIHKSQGSEYPAVVIPLTTQHYVMLQRNLVYTGVTRGKRLVVLVGQRQALAIAVKGAQTRRRWSKLREWLSGCDRL